MISCYTLRVEIDSPIKGAHVVTTLAFFLTPRRKKNKSMVSSESEDESSMCISEDVQQSLGVGKDLNKARQSSSSQRSKGGVRQSLGKASDSSHGQSFSQEDCLIQELRKKESSLKGISPMVTIRYQGGHGGKVRKVHQRHHKDYKTVRRRSNPHLHCLLTSPPQKVRRSENLFR